MTNDIKHLLAPRYEVIADYPNSDFKVGEVLFSINYAVIDKKDWYVFSTVKENFNYNIHSYIQQDDITKYPHLFRPLHWAEKRELSELPKYVKVKEVVYKVDIWKDTYVNGNLPLIRNDGNDGKFISLDWHFNKYDSTPATEQEYLTYINNKK